MFITVVISACGGGGSPGKAEGPTIVALSSGSQLPMSLLTISGSGFDPTASLSVSFSDGQGFSVEVPVAQASVTSATVAVPPFIKMATGAFGPGTVTVQLIQKKGETASNSNIKSGFQIQDLPIPSSTMPAGKVTLDYLTALRDFTVQIKSKIVGTPLNTSDVNGALSNQISNVTELITQVQAAMQEPSNRFQVGSIKGTPLSIGSAELLNVDRLIMGILSTQSSGPTPITTSSFKNLFSLSAAHAQSTSTCQAQVAGNWEKAIETGGIADGSGYFLSFVSPCGDVAPTAQAISDGASYFAAVGAVALSGIYIVGTLAGVEVTAALVLPALAITLPLAVLGAGSIMVAGALGNTNPDADALLKKGVDQVNSLLEVAIAKGALLGIPPILTAFPATRELGHFVENIPEPVIALAGIFGGGLKLIDVFGATVINNPLPTASLSLSSRLSTGSETFPSGKVTSDDGKINCIISETSLLSFDAHCAANYTAGAQVTLTATPDSGSIFMNWEGGNCTGIEPCVVTFTEDMTSVVINVNFAKKTATLSLSAILINGVSGTPGSGLVISADRKINCNISGGPLDSHCLWTYDINTPVTITAIPTGGSTFFEWSDNCSGKNPSIMITLTGSMLCTVTFIGP